MGFAGIAAGVGAATALAGAGISYSASSHAASAAQSAQEQELEAQNTAFQSRISAQNQQTAEQAAVEDQGNQAYQQAESQMRETQSQALQDEQSQLTAMDKQEQQIQDTTQQQVQQTTQQEVTPASLQQAQAASEAARMAPVQQTAQDISASNPLPSPGEGSATKSALAKAMSDAATYTENYGQNLATLGAYQAPLQAVNLATTNLKTNLLEPATADTLLKAGVNARLLPSETAYSGAGTIGQAEIAANTQNVSNRMQLAATRATYAENLADLGQTDTDANIQSALNVTQARDAATSSLGQGLTGLGTAAIGFGASQGAFSGLSNWFNGTSLGSGIADATASLSPSSGIGAVLNSGVKTAAKAVTSY